MQRSTLIHTLNQLKIEDPLNSDGSLKQDFYTIIERNQAMRKQAILPLFPGFEVTCIHNDEFHLYCNNVAEAEIAKTRAHELGFKHIVVSQNDLYENLSIMVTVSNQDARFTDKGRTWYHAHQKRFDRLANDIVFVEVSDEQCTVIVTNETAARRVQNMLDTDCIITQPYLDAWKVCAAISFEGVAL